MTPRTIYIARHGERLDFVDPNWFSTAAHPHDPPLTADGVRQATELGAHLAPLGVRHVFTSPFTRCVNTAVAVARRCDERLRVHVEPGLCEWLNAQWYAASERGPIWRDVASLKEEFDEVDEEYVPVFGMGYNFEGFPESERGLFRRCRQTAAAIVERLVGEEEGNVLLVGHGSSVDALNKELVPGIGNKDIHYCSLSECLPTSEPMKYTMGLHCDVSFLSEVQPGNKPRYV